MKVDRLLGIVTLLLQKKRIKARDLADYFEVSLRTIYRDIEDINLSGIPIIAYPGANGGVSIAEGFTLDKTVLTREEMGNIVRGLKSLDSVISEPQIKKLLDKFPQEPDRYIVFNDDIMIDLASHYKTSLALKISQLRKAIRYRRVVEFDYYSKNGQTKREFEPYFVTFKWAAWYVFGYCRLRGDFRLFKLNRMTELTLTEINFEPREVTEQQLDLEAFYLAPGKRQYASLLLHRSLEYVMVDQYGPESYEVVDEDHILAKWDYIDQHEMVKIILSLGGGARVLAPQELADAVREEAERILEQYFLS